MPKTLSCFIDEAGSEGGAGRYERHYLVTLVLHDQDDDLSEVFRSNLLKQVRRKLMA